MKTYIALLRGINVGGKNIVPMADLRERLKKGGFSGVSTYIASGNVLVDSNKSPKDIQSAIEKILLDNFTLDSALIKVIVLSHEQLESINAHKPKGFGEAPNTYHSDVIFLMDINLDDAIAVFDPREGVDAIWPGDGVIYSQRLSVLRTKSHLNKIMGTTVYRSMTIRSWNTVRKLLSLLDAHDER